MNELTEQADLIKQLEAALREAHKRIEFLSKAHIAALKRQENDDVFPGFRGNNDSA